MKKLIILKLKWLVLKKHKGVNFMETIMIVEDNEIILNGLELSLKQDGYNIIKASTKKKH